MGTSATVSGEAAAKGRYCWSVWPVIEDPKLPGRVSQRQPKVTPVQFCYTSAPAEPSVVCQPHPSGTGFSPDPIHCEVTFPYVPDAQHVTLVEGAAADHMTLVQDCVLDPAQLYFKDFYDCHWKFDILPVENQHYKVTTQVFNSDKFPVPVKDASSLVWEASDEFETKACGASGEACCAGQHCDATDLTCSKFDTCIACGGPGQLCCTSPGQPACKGDNAVCQPIGQQNLCCAASLAPPILLQPPGLMNAWNMMKNTQSACFKASFGGGPQDACSQEIQAAIDNGIVPTTPRFEVGWTQVGSAAQYKVLVSSFGLQGITTTTYTTTGLEIGFLETLNEAAGVKWVNVRAVDGCLRESNSSEPGIFIYQPQP
jgi:hypothetical protein